MQELEKILDEIENERTDIDDYSDAKGRMLARHWNDCIDVVKDIIRKQMNDGWIPVEDRLPEDGTYLCTLAGELCGIEEPFTGMCGIENGIWDEPDCVIAWHPLPEPYRPESETKKPDWREDMLRKFNRRE